jgi:hypothetical protein
MFTYKYVILTLLTCMYSLFQGNLLDRPRTELDSHYFFSSMGLGVGISSMQGWRPSMEDSHVFVDIPSRRDHLFLAIFDGYVYLGRAHIFIYI